MTSYIDESDFSIVHRKLPIQSFADYSQFPKPFQRSIGYLRLDLSREQLVVFEICVAS